MTSSNPQPAVNMTGIEHLAWSTRKKVNDDGVFIVTKFSFEAEPNAEQIRTLHNLLKNGGPLTASFRSPALQMDMELKLIEEEKSKELGER